MRKIIFNSALLVISVAFLNLMAAQVYSDPLNSTPSQQYATELEDDRNIQDLTEAVRTVPLEKQKSVFLEYLASNIPINLPGYWKMVDDPNQALAFLTYFSEPYNPNILDMLERVLPKASYKQRIHIASILYRYDRASGKTYLSSLLDKNADYQAALIFALNKDESKLPQIFNVLTASENVTGKIMQRESQPAPVKLALSEDEKIQLRDALLYEAQLIRELSSWHDPRIAPILYKIFQQQPNKSYLAMALAEQNYRDAIPLMRTLYFSAPLDSPGKVDAGAALVKLDGSGANQVLKFLTFGLRQVHDGTDTSVMQEIANEDFGLLKIDTATPALKEEIENYLSPKKSIGSPSITQLVSPMELAVGSADALSKIHDSSSADLVTRLLKHLIKLQVQSSYVFRVADSLFTFRSSQTDIKTLMGKQWYKRKLLIQQLKPLPHYLLPTR